MTITTIAFDGDDTLWHHENFFNEAKQQFHDFMNSLGTFPDAGEQLDTQHILDLQLWGYGVKGYILTMVELAIRMTEGRITGEQMQKIMDIGRELYLHPVRLLDHVAETIGQLENRYQLLLITKGDLVAQEMKISKSGIGKYFDAIEIVSEKNTETYRKIFDRYRIKPAQLIMVGNSIRSDILPPIQLGAQAIHIPYHTSWHFEQAEIAESDRGNFVVLPSMKGLPAILDRLQKSGQDKLAAVCQEASA